MEKKTNHTKTAIPEKRAAKRKPATEKAAPATPAAKSKRAGGAVKPAPRRIRKPAFSQEDVALRAYFIAERRVAAGLPGDTHQDWIEAERQLASEVDKAGKSKPKKKKA